MNAYHVSVLNGGVLTRVFGFLADDPWYAAIAAKDFAGLPGRVRPNLSDSNRFTVNVWDPEVSETLPMWDLEVLPDTADFERFRATFTQE